MKKVLRAGSFLAGITLAWLLAQLGTLWLSISISATAARLFIDSSVLLACLSLILAAVAYTCTVVLALMGLKLLPGFYLELTLEVKAAMLSRRRQKLRDRIASMPVIYLRYPIYPELKILKDYRKY